MQSFVGGDDDQLIGALCGESATASSGLLSLIHEHILACSVVPPGGEAPSGGHMARLLLTVASHLGVVAEIAAERFLGGEGAKWSAIAQLECFKAACRISLLAKRPDLVLLQGGQYGAPLPPRTPYDPPSALEQAMVAAVQRQSAYRHVSGGKGGKQSCAHSFSSISHA